LLPEAATTARVETAVLAHEYLAELIRQRPDIGLHIYPTERRKNQIRITPCACETEAENSYSDRAACLAEGLSFFTVVSQLKSACNPVHAAG
jgi:hypothetical protein